MTLQLAHPATFFSSPALLLLLLSPSETRDDGDIERERVSVLVVGNWSPFDVGAASLVVVVRATSEDESASRRARRSDGKVKMDGGSFGLAGGAIFIKRGRGMEVQC